MAFPFSDDHEMIRDAVRGYLQDWYEGGKGPERVSQSGTGFDVEAWRGLATNLGMAGIAIDEHFGGAGLGDLGRVIVMEELGASLCSVPFMSSSTIAADMVAKIGTHAAKTEWLPRLASGEIVGTYFEGHDAFEQSNGTLSGHVSMVLYAAQADYLFFTLRSGGFLQLLAMPRDTAGVSIIPVTTMDPTRSFADIALDDVALDDLQIIGKGAPEAIETVVKTSFIALAAECVGGAQACLDMTLEYAAQRVQFDRPIASFQAIKHRCADMFVLVEAARSAVYAAALAEGDRKVELALIAKAYAADAFFKVAGDAIQLHGGIGFTWEYPLHYFFKRARANRSVFGSSDRDYARLADQILGEAA